MNEINHNIEIGNRIRSYDFEPFPGRKDHYVEGTVTGETNDGRWIVSVEFDSVFEPGQRTEILTPKEMFICEFDGRLTVID